MKTRLLQCLFLGGVYQIISIILNFIPATALLNGLFYIVFLIAAIITLVHWLSGKISSFSAEHKNITTILYALGWMPYFQLPYVIFVNYISYQTAMAAYHHTEYIPEYLPLLESYLKVYFNIYIWGALASLLVAIGLILYRRFSKKV